MQHSQETGVRSSDMWLLSIACGNVGQLSSVGFISMDESEAAGSPLDIAEDELGRPAGDR